MKRKLGARIFSCKHEAETEQSVGWGYELSNPVPRWCTCSSRVPPSKGSMTSLKHCHYLRTCCSIRDPIWGNFSLMLPEEQSNLFLTQKCERMQLLCGLVPLSSILSPAWACFHCSGCLFSYNKLPWLLPLSMCPLFQVIWTGNPRVWFQISVHACNTLIPSLSYVRNIIYNPEPEK